MGRSGQGNASRLGFLTEPFVEPEADLLLGVPCSRERGRPLPCQVVKAEDPETDDCLESLRVALKVVFENCLAA